MKSLYHISYGLLQVSTFFRSIKHYFLLDQGDFFVCFMDLAEDEMRKNADGIFFCYFQKSHNQCDSFAFREGHV